jgi:MYXO-CTERM domain-containing protein
MKTSVLIAGFSSVALVSLAHADIIGEPVTIHVSSQLGERTLVVTRAMGTWNSETGEYDYQRNSPLVIENDSGQRIATMNNLSMYCQSDPFVNLGFAFQSGAFPTTITISTGINTFPGPLTNPTASSSATMTLTDTDSNGATVAGGFGGFAFRALYNGSASVYSSNVAAFGVPGGSNFSSQGFSNPIVGTASDIHTEFSFTISANDSVSGTSNFTVTPTPASFALLGLGGLSLARRRRS